MKVIQIVRQVNVQVLFEIGPACHLTLRQVPSVLERTAVRAPSPSLQLLESIRQL